MTASPETGAASGLGIEARGLRLSYGDRQVLRGLDLSVAPGEWVAVVGPNGCGKTTLLRVLAGLQRPDGGSVQIGRADAWRSLGRSTRGLMGVAAHQSLLYAELSVIENLRLFADLYDVHTPDARIPIALHRFGLGSYARTRVAALSRGLIQRLTLARATIHEPPILLLDEPDTGLDVDAQSRLKQMLCDDRGRSQTVVLTTHDLAQAVLLADRLELLHRGTLVASRASSDFSGESPHDWYRDAVASDGCNPFVAPLS